MIHRTNFLEQSSVRRFRRTAFFFLLVVCAIFLVTALPVVFLGRAIYANAEHGRTVLIRAEAAAVSLDFDTALADADRAAADFTTALRYLKPLSLLSSVPLLGPHVVAAKHLLVSGVAVTSSARDLFIVGRDVFKVAKDASVLQGSLFTGIAAPSTQFKDLTREQKRSVLAAFAAASPKLTDALQSIDEALEVFSQIPTSELAETFQNSLAPIRQQLLDVQSAIATIEPIAAMLPGVLGYPEARHYLFFFQNNTELRPTGGFLGVYGALTVQDAELIEMTTSDVYAIDGPAESSPRPAPPAPIRKYIGIEKWYLRDANWSPDFPTSAAVMQRFFREEAAIAFRGKPIPPVDGIIAVTPKFAEDIMRLTGPITVDGKTFTPENLVDTLEFEVEQGFVKGGIPFHQRKDIVGKLVKEIVMRLSSFSLVRLVEVVGTVDQNIKEGHVMVYSADAKLQSTFVTNGWAGAMKSVNGDYLRYIDANLAALKSDAVIDRAMTYQITPDGKGEYDGKVVMTYHNKGSFTWKTTRYRTYVRLYLPAGTTFIGATGAMENDKLKDPRRRPGKVDMSDELDRRVFGAFISIEPGETKSLEFRFHLAPSVARMIQKGEYTLDVQKQAGTVANGLTLDLDFGKKLVNATPSEDRSHWGDARYTVGTDLRVDRVFDIRF